MTNALDEHEARVANTRFLHVANGTSTTRLIEAAGIPGKLSIWADPLHEGPVPGGLTEAQLLDLRGRYHQESGEITFSAWSGSDPSLDPANDLQRWRAAIDDHDSSDELILWFEHDLFDQLNLIQLLAWIRERVPAAKPVSLVCIGSFPGRPAFKGLGELTPDELAPLLETRQRISEQQYALANEAWSAFREPTPEPLDQLRSRDTSALPYLAPAVTRFLEEYPSTVDGLSRTERRLLELADGDRVTLARAFPRMHEGETAYYVSDTSLAAMAEALSRTSPPLLVLDPESATSDEGLRGSVILTDAGRAVLRRHQDRVAMCGVERWLGGVHLEGRGPVWRWDPDRGRIIRA
jgi:hypothetical protein